MPTQFQNQETKKPVPIILGLLPQAKYRKQIGLSPTLVEDKCCYARSQVHELDTLSEDHEVVKSRWNWTSLWEQEDLPGIP